MVGANKIRNTRIGLLLFCLAVGLSVGFSPSLVTHTAARAAAVDAESSGDGLRVPTPSSKIDLNGGWTELFGGALDIFRSFLGTSTSSLSNSDDEVTDTSTATFSFPKKSQGRGSLSPSIFLPLPKCDKFVRNYFRRTYGPKLRALEGDLLKASAAVTEWKSALDHPRPLLFKNVTLDAFAEFVSNQTIDAEVNLSRTESRVREYKDTTFTKVVMSMFTACYRESVEDWSPSASLLMRTTAFSKKVGDQFNSFSPEKADLAAARKHVSSKSNKNSKNSPTKSRSGDEDVITDEDDEDEEERKPSKNEKGEANRKNQQKKNQREAALEVSAPLNLRSHPSLAGLQWLTRFQIFAEIHTGVLIATLSATIRDYLDFTFLPSWRAFRSFYNGYCEKTANEWWWQADRRFFAAKRLIYGLSPSASESVFVPSSVEDNTAKDDHSQSKKVLRSTIPALASTGEGLTFGPRPGTPPKQLDPKLGKVSYVGKEEEDKKWADRKARGLKDPFLWLDLTEAAHVVPENASFTAFLLFAEAILCYSVSMAITAGSILTAGTLLCLVFLTFPVVFCYVVHYRWFYGIFVREFFWNFFVHNGFSDSGSNSSSENGLLISAPTALSIKTFLASLRSGQFLSAVNDGIFGPSASAFFGQSSNSAEAGSSSSTNFHQPAHDQDGGAAALPLLLFFALLAMLTFAFVVIPTIWIALEIIGTSEAFSRKTALALRAHRARELLAIREKKERERIRQLGSSNNRSAAPPIVSSAVRASLNTAVRNVKQKSTAVAGSQAAAGSEKQSSK